MAPRIPIAAAAIAALTSAAEPPASAPDVRFGVMTHFAQGWDPAWIPSLAEGGISTVRDEIYWAAVEPRRGDDVFPPRYENAMAILRRSGVDPLIVLDFQNPNYDGGLTPHTADGIAGYAAYAGRVLRRYGGQIHAVEIWNEYNGTFCTGPATGNRSGTYLRMLRAAYRTIKAGWPGVTVAGGATSGIPMPYWEKLLAGGALDSMDVLSVHPYRYESPPEGLETEIAGLDRLVRRYNGGRPKPIWVSEIGWGLKPSTAPGDLAIGEMTQAKFLVRAYGLLLSAGVGRIYWYEYRDEQGLGMGLVRADARNSRKPAFFAMATLIRQLRGAAFVRREKTLPGVYSLLFERPDGSQVRLLWSLAPITVPAAGAESAVDMLGNPLPVVDRWSLGDAPIFVTGHLTGLPPEPPVTEVAIADSSQDFSSSQGRKGWSYGDFDGDGAAFVPLGTFSATDWTEAWGGPFPYLSITAGDQAPSAIGRRPVAAVRRWVSDRSATVHVVGAFKCTARGDGVGVSVLVGGRRLFRDLLGGGRSLVRPFDFTQAVRPGTPIDFAVDPGPGVNIDYDATTLKARISVPNS